MIETETKGGNTMCDFRVERKLGIYAHADFPCRNKAKFNVEYKLSKSGSVFKRNCCTTHKKALERAIKNDLGISELISAKNI